MKREQIILQQLNDTQLRHAANMINKEVKRRSDAPPAPPRRASRSGMHARVEPEKHERQPRQKKTGT